MGCAASAACVIPRECTVPAAGRRTGRRSPHVDGGFRFAIRSPVDDRLDGGARTSTKTVIDSYFYTCTLDTDGLSLLPLTATSR